MAMKFLKTPYPASMNDGNHIFVFGSNCGGVHGAGAALEAKRSWGAVHGNPAGFQGRSYAIPTKDRRFKTLPLNVIESFVDRFISACKKWQQLTFLVTPIGTGLAGYSHAQIAPMFKDAPSNCIMTEEWKTFLFSDCNNQNPE